MSAALSETEADMLTRGREPVDKSSGKYDKNYLANYILESVTLY